MDTDFVNLFVPDLSTLCRHYLQNVECFSIAFHHDMGVFFDNFQLFSDGNGTVLKIMFKDMSFIVHPLWSTFFYFQKASLLIVGGK